MLFLVNTVLHDAQVGCGRVYTDGGEWYVKI